MRTRNEEFLLSIPGKTARSTSKLQVATRGNKGLVAAIWNRMSLSQSSRKPPPREFIKVVATRDGPIIFENGL